MPDIAMCKGDNCPMKEDCYRYTAKPNSYQSYFTSIPFDAMYRECEHFWDNKERAFYNKDNTKET
jgi:hypothetical protein